ncbi:DUF2281 domain-containing protein [candidate division KSB1 bacterium]|nr:DUF2281 domain-containing protein [candidate division KSB1 bacterium]
MDDTIFQSKILSIPKSIQQEMQNYLDYLLFKNDADKLKKHPKAGCMKGTFKMKDDFDEPLADFKEYME